jgi:hypothetical protein
MEQQKNPAPRQFDDDDDDGNYDNDDEGVLSSCFSQTTLFFTKFRILVRTFESSELYLCLQIIPTVLP